MADTFGLLQLPALVTEPAGDPALAKIGSFLAAIINANASAAWLAVRPRAAAGQQPPVRNVVVGHDPTQLDFNESLLPALFIWRPGGTNEWWAEDFLMDNASLRAMWILPPDAQEKQKLRLPILNAIAKACTGAIDDNRHPAWFDADDTDLDAPTYAAAPTAFLLPVATSTSPQVYSGAGLTGALGASALTPRRGLTITTTAAAGAYAGPIVATWIDWLGQTQTSSYPLALNGGETVNIGDELKQLVSLSVPAQHSTAGSISAGTPLRQGLGSQILDIASLERLNVQSWSVTTFKIQVVDGDQRVTDQKSYYALDMRIESREQRVREDSALAYPNTRIDVAIQRSDKSVIENASFPDAADPIPT